MKYYFPVGVLFEILHFTSFQIIHTTCSEIYISFLKQDPFSFFTNEDEMFSTEYMSMKRGTSIRILIMNAEKYLNE